MTPAEHYQEADRLLRTARKIDTGYTLAPDRKRAELIAEAQVHATLALYPALAVTVPDADVHDLTVARATSTAV